MEGTIHSGSPKGILVSVPSPGWAGMPSQEGTGCFSTFAGGGLDSHTHPLALVSPVSELSRVKQREGSVVGTRFQGCASVLLSAGVEV